MIEPYITLKQNAVKKIRDTADALEKAKRAGIIALCAGELDSLAFILMGLAHEAKNKEARS